MWSWRGFELTAIQVRRRLPIFQTRPIHLQMSCKNKRQFNYFHSFSLKNLSIYCVLCFVLSWKNKDKNPMLKAYTAEEMYQNLEENRNHLFTLRDYFIEEVEKLDSKTQELWDFPGGPVVKIPCSHYSRHRFDPWLGN